MFYKILNSKNGISDVEFHNIVRGQYVNPAVQNVKMPTSDAVALYARNICADSILVGPPALQLRRAIQLFFLMMKSVGVDRVFLTSNEVLCYVVTPRDAEDISKDLADFAYTAWEQVLSYPDFVDVHDKVVVATTKPSPHLNSSSSITYGFVVKFTRRGSAFTREQIEAAVSESLTVE